MSWWKFSGLVNLSVVMCRCRCRHAIIAGGVAQWFFMLNTRFVFPVCTVAPSLYLSSRVLYFLFEAVYVKVFNQVRIGVDRVVVSIPPDLQPRGADLPHPATVQASGACCEEVLVLNSMFGCCGAYHLLEIEGVRVHCYNVRVRVHWLMVNGHIVSGSVKHVMCPMYVLRPCFSRSVHSASGRLQRAGCCCCIYAFHAVVNSSGMLLSGSHVGAHMRHFHHIDLCISWAPAPG
jgi:hypothetical protein